MDAPDVANLSRFIVSLVLLNSRPFLYIPSYQVLLLLRIECLHYMYCYAIVAVLELVLTHEYTRERVGNTYPREREQISLLVHQGEHISSLQRLRSIIISMVHCNSPYVVRSTVVLCGPNNTFKNHQR